MRLDLRKTGWQQISGDREGLEALRALIDEVLKLGHGLSAPGLPIISLLNEKGHPVMPPRATAPAPTLKHPKAESA